ncbi:MAG: hypothetical protein ACOCV8_03895 [Spirochaetota bacterium]
MRAVGNITMLKPDSGQIPIDKDNDDTPVYLDKAYHFYIDIENKGRLNYTVKPLTFNTEHKLLSVLNKHLLKYMYEPENLHNVNKNLQALLNTLTIKGEGIDTLIIEYSQCLNPEIILPELNKIFKAYTKSELEHIDYINLYKKLVDIGYYKISGNIISRKYYKRKKIKSLQKEELNQLKQLSQEIVKAYTKALLLNQETYLKYKILVNLVKYERNFKKKLLNLFLIDLKSMEKPINPDLENSILYSEQNADMTKTGYTIPVF